MRLEYFQMIDRFVEINTGERKIKAICKVPTESPVFEGHFPGFALMPGVLLIECMAQTTGWMVSVLTGFTGLPMLVGLKNAKIRNAVFPGAELTFEGVIEHVGSGYAMAKCKGKSKDGPICDADLAFRLTPYPGPEFRLAMVEMGKKVGIEVPELMK
jgi:3-hydroxyacyl-[acyl-carrier-protein] dehydratase